MVGAVALPNFAVGMQPQFPMAGYQPPQMALPPSYPQMATAYPTPSLAQITVGIQPMQQQFSMALQPMQQVPMLQMQQQQVPMLQMQQVPVPFQQYSQQVMPFQPVQQQAPVPTKQQQYPIQFADEDSSDSEDEPDDDSSDSSENTDEDGGQYVF